MEFDIPVADEENIMHFCSVVTPMYDAISWNICENQQLATLWDTLLPKLMSGEFYVSNIESAKLLFGGYDEKYIILK